MLEIEEFLYTYFECMNSDLLQLRNLLLIKFMQVKF